MDATTGSQPPTRRTHFIEALNRILNAKVMGFMAIAAFGMAIQELVFGVSPDVLEIIRYCQITVFFLFFLEYLKGLFFAPNRVKFLVSPARIVDLVILILAWASFLPQVADPWINAQALQVFRLAPVLFFGYLGTREISLQLTVAEEKMEFVEATYIRIDPGHPENPRQEISQGELLTWLSDYNRTGFYVSHGSLTQDLAKILSSNSIPPALLANALSESSFPRSVHVGNLFLFSGAIPVVTLQPNQIPLIVRSRFVAIFTERSVLLMIGDKHPMGEELARKVRDLPGFTQATIAFRAMAALFNLVSDHYEIAATDLEMALRAIELTPLKKRNDDIYQTVYFLRRNLTSMKSDLWRISHLLQSIERGHKSTVFNITEEKDFFALLGHTTEYLHDTFEQLEDNASALLDLRINMVSFEMNRFMGLIAVVTALGLIPTTISGFLGMNIDGVNFHISLANVAFIALMLIILALYMLRNSGWLKFR